MSHSCLRKRIKQVPVLAVSPGTNASRMLTNPKRNGCCVVNGVVHCFVQAGSGIHLDLLAKRTLWNIKDTASHSSPASGVQTLGEHGVASRGWSAEVYARVGSEAEQSSRILKARNGRRTLTNRDPGELETGIRSNNHAH